MLALVAAICLSFSCGPGDGGPSGDPQTQLPLVDGLDSDADNQRLRFYVDTSQNAPGLYAFDPAQPEQGGILVDEDLSLLQPHFTQLPSGTFDSANERFLDYQPAHLYYTVWGTPPSEDTFANPATYGEQRRISTDPATLEDGPVRVSTTTLSAPVLSNSARFRAYDLSDPLDSSLVIQTPGEGWIRVRPSYDDTHAPDSFGDSVEVVSSVWGPEVRDNAGWLVFDTQANGDGDTGVLQRFDDELSSVGDVHYKDSGEVVKDVERAKYLNDFADGTVLVALGIGENAAGQVWLYESSSEPGNAGTIKSLLNQQGEPLIISFAALGIDENEDSVSPPASNLTSVNEDALYFAHGPGLVQQDWTRLFRVDRDGWAVYDHQDYASADGSSSTTNAFIESFLAPFLIEVGQNQLFWSLGGQNEIVDVSNPDPAQWTRTPIDAEGGEAEGTPVYATANGWVYYNSNDEEAVALNVDSGESVALDDARWIGASSSGSTTTLNGRAKQAGISEVFLLRQSTQLAAVEAANPLEGMVVLGELDTPPEEVRLFGADPGPHRLAQVEYDDDAFEVIYMNTRQENSLRALTAAPVTEWDKSLEGGSSVTISAAGTRPVGRF
jgi:hypothetical protein